MSIAGDLFLVVYSVDCRETFDEARRLQEQVFLAKGGHTTTATAHHHGGRARPPYVPLVIVGNKADRDSERVVDASELKTLVDRYPNCCAGVETSAKYNHNVDEVHRTHSDSLRSRCRCHSEISIQ